MNYSGFCLMWKLVDVGSHLIWTFYQEQNHLPYYVHYITAVNMDNYLVNVDNQLQSMCNKGQLVLIRS